MYTKKILIIDDDALLLKALKMELLVHLPDFEIHIADSLSGADNLLSSNSYKLLILDYCLADGNSLDWIESNNKLNTNFTAVLLITSFNDKEVYNRALSLNVDAFLSKGCNLNEIISISKTLTNLKLKEILYANSFKNMVLIAENIDTGILVFDNQKKLLEFNSYAKELVLQLSGVNIEKAMQFDDIFSISQFEYFNKFEFCSNSLIAKDVITLEKARYINIEVTMNAIFFEDEISNYTISLRNITQQIENEKTLKKQQALLIQSSKATNVGTWEYLPELKKLWWDDNTKLIQDLPLTSEPDLVDALEVYTNGSREIIRNAFEKAIVNGEPYDLTLDIFTKADRHKKVHTISAINKNAEGKVNSVFGIILDITKQWQDEHELIQSRANLQSVIENSDALIYSIDCNYQIIYTNSSIQIDLANCLGLYNDNVSNFSDFDLNDDKKYWFDNLEISLKGSKIQFERTIEYEKGLKYFEIIFNPIYGNGNIFGANIFINDITRFRKQEAELNNHRNKLEELVKTQTRFLEKEVELRKLAEAELSQAYQREIISNDMKSRFVKMISHEFRTPLSQIIMSADITFSQIQRNTPELTDKFKKYNNSISEGVEQITDIIDLTSEFFNIEQSLKNISFEKIDLRTFVNTFTHTFEVKKKLNNRITILERKSHTIRTSPLILEMILSQLLSNAINFSDSLSPVEIDYGMVDNHFFIEVIDYGSGIPLKEHDQIFDLFYRGNKANNLGNKRGLGVGLTIVKLCVDTLNGTIELQSQENQGSKFKILIPINTEELQ